MLKGRGFTILELLVVVAIIAMLSAVTLVLLSGAREKSRDATRVAQLRQVENALNLYFTNHNRFPIETLAVTITGSDSFSTALISDEAIAEVSADPAHPSYTYTYQSDSLGSSYTITFCLETDTIGEYAKGCSNTLTP